MKRKLKPAGTPRTRAGDLTVAKLIRFTPEQSAWLARQENGSNVLRNLLETAMAAAGDASPAH